MQLSLQFNVQLKILIARLNVLRNRIKSRLDTWATLRVKENNKFKIVQISNTYIIINIKICKDTINIYKNYLLKSEINLLIIQFIEKILNIEKQDIVILIRDQLHYNIFDS